jgi:hypothetical protein
MLLLPALFRFRLKGGPGSLILPVSTLIVDDKESIFDGELV